MNKLTIEWTAHRLANDEDEARGFAAAEAVMINGGDWHSIASAFHDAMTQGWANPDVDSYTLSTAELNAAAPLMDDDLREAIHDDTRATDPIWFLTEYRHRHFDKFGNDFVIA